VHPVFERNETRKSSLPAMSIRAMIHALGLLASGWELTAASGPSIYGEVRTFIRD
jgi:hypothetical protein